jgi:hypothetical protein
VGPARAAGVVAGSKLPGTSSAMRAPVGVAGPTMLVVAWA